MPLTFFEIEDNYKSQIELIYKQMLKYHKLKDIFDIDLSLVSAEEIKEINKESRKVDSVTDVLSFPFCEISLPIKKSEYKFDINPETKNISLGEIILCDEKISEQALDFGHSKEREAGYLVLHGLLHLLGYDHIIDEDKAKMRIVEESVLAELNIVR